MPEPTLISPNSGNYRVGKGAWWFKKEGAADYVHMGNSPEAEFTPEIEKLEHFSSMEGVKEKDASIVLSRGGAIKLILEEWTPANMELALLGTLDLGAAGGPTVQIFDNDEVSGELKFISANSKGPKWDFYYHNVSFIPSAALNPISDEWGQMEINGEVLVGQVAPNVGKFGYAQLTNLAS